MNARLRTERQNTDARCANCSWWGGKDSGMSAAECGLHSMKTLDLAKCADHRPHDGVLEGDVLKAE